MSRARVRKAFAWVMLLSMAAGSAWPFLSHARRTDANLEVCSIHGKKTGGDGTGGFPAGDNSRDCAMCSMASEKPVARSSDAWLFLLSALQLDEDYASPADFIPPWDLLRYPPARPRAPPALLS